MNALHISLRVTSPEPDVARVSVGSRQFSVGRPLEFDEASARVAAIEYFLGAVGGEVVNGMRTFAERRRLPIDAIEAVVTGELNNGLTYLEVVGEQEQPRITSIRIKVFVDSGDVAATRALFEHTLARLPLVCTLRPALALTIELILTT